MIGATMSAAAEAVVLGPFVLVRFLGEGGGGVVHEARRTDGASGHPPTFALKILRDELALSEKERKRFLDEAARMRRVEHEGLMPLFDAGELPDGRPYLTMPCLNGESLAHRLARGPLPVAEAVRHFGMLARAVQAVHDAGMLHRDIKPENIFLDGVPPRAVLLDFGIARDISGERSTTTALGRVRGTPAYMAPERFFGTSANIATDVYELGVVLYMMLTGSLPWGVDASASERLHPAPPAGVLPALADLVLRSLSMRPEQRPADAATFARQVEARYAAPHTVSMASVEQERRTADVFARDTADAVAYAPTVAHATPVAPVTEPLAIITVPPPSLAARPRRWPFIAILLAGCAAGGTAYVRVASLRRTPAAAPAGLVAPPPPSASASASASASTLSPMSVPVPVPDIVSSSPAPSAAHSSAPPLKHSRPAPPKPAAAAPPAPPPDPVPVPAPAPTPTTTPKDKLLEDRK